jgi:hypothetical protein
LIKEVLRMANKLNLLLKRLEESVEEPDFIAIAYEIIGQIEGKPYALQAIQPMIALMEHNPEADFGGPGPLVHFIETFDHKQYEDILIESIRRNPTITTLWMINRLINNLDVQAMMNYYDVLEEVMEKNELRPHIKEEIERSWGSSTTSILKLWIKMF